MSFPNLARAKEQHDSESAAIDLIVQQELETAGITLHKMPFLIKGEVPTHLLGLVEGTGWAFERRWYYYSAKGPGLPPDVADRLHLSHGHDVRVGGHCGCPSPREWFKGFACGQYHVDTPEGLKALADNLKAILAEHAGCQDGTTEVAS